MLLHELPSLGLWDCLLERLLYIPVAHRCGSEICSRVDRPRSILQRAFLRQLKDRGGSGLGWKTGVQDGLVSSMSLASRLPSGRKPTSTQRPQHSLIYLATGHPAETSCKTKTGHHRVRPRQTVMETQREGPLLQPGHVQQRSGRIYCRTQKSRKTGSSLCQGWQLSVHSFHQNQRTRTDRVSLTDLRAQLSPP